MNDPLTVLLNHGVVVVVLKQVAHWTELVTPAHVVHARLENSSFLILKIKWRFDFSDLASIWVKLTHKYTDGKLQERNSSYDFFMNGGIFSNAKDKNCDETIIEGRLHNQSDLSRPSRVCFFQSFRREEKFICSKKGKLFLDFKKF